MRSWSRRRAVAPDSTCLVLPETFEPILRQRGIARGVLDVLVTEVSLEGAGIVAVVRELVATGVAKHVGMSFDFQLRGNGRPLDQAREAGS